MFKPETCPHCGVDSENLIEVHSIVREENRVIIGTIPSWECQACGGETVTQEGYAAHVKLIEEHRKAL